MVLAGYSYVVMGSYRVASYIVVQREGRLVDELKPVERTIWRGGGAVGIFSELLVGLNDSFKSVCNRVDLFSAPGEI